MMFLVDPGSRDDCEAGEGDEDLPQPLAHEGLFLATAGGSSGDPEDCPVPLATAEAVEVEDVMDGGISLLLVFSVCSGVGRSNGIWGSGPTPGSISGYSSFDGAKREAYFLVPALLEDNLELGTKVSISGCSLI